VFGFAITAITARGDVMAGQEKVELTRNRKRPPTRGTLGQLLQGVDLWGLPRGEFSIRRTVGPVDVSARRVAAPGGHRLEGSVGAQAGSGYVSVGRDDSGQFARVSAGPVAAAVSRRKGEQIRGYGSVTLPKKVRVTVGRDHKGQFASVTKSIQW
jgi:hypothetical protein